MNKKVLISIIVVVVLVIVIYLCAVENSKRKVQTELDNAYNVWREKTEGDKTELNSGDEETVANNKTNSHKVEVTSQPNNTVNEITSQNEKNINLEDIKIDVVDETISKTGVTIVVTDNNETSNSWGEEYKIECKKENNWVELTPKETVIVKSIAYNKDENNQIKFNIDWEKYYGELEKGIYRIVKPQYINGEYINLYSNEFEISD